MKIVSSQTVIMVKKSTGGEMGRADTMHQE